jgi:hypothetical protein
MRPRQPTTADTRTQNWASFILTIGRANLRYILIDPALISLASVMDGCAAAMKPAPPSGAEKALFQHLSTPWLQNH